MSNYNLIAAIIQGILGFYIATSIMVVCAHVPQSMKFHAYRRAKQMMVCAFALIVGQMAMILAFLPYFSKHENTIAVNVIFFYGITIFYSHAFLHMLDGKYSTIRQLLYDISGWALAIALSLVALQCSPAFLKKMFVISASLTLVAFTALFVIKFMRKYTEVTRELDNYYSERTQYFVAWLRRSVIIIVFCGVSSVVSLYMPLALMIAHMAILTLANIYIALSFIGYVKVYAKVNASSVLAQYKTSSEQPTPQAISTNPKRLTSTFPNKQQTRLLQEWIANEQYCQPHLTIKIMAKDIRSNRTYLSQYINNTYHLTFNKFIERLRIDKAKSLILSEHNNIQRLACRLGFSSTSYFIRVFTDIEGMTPQKWKKMNAHANSTKQQRTTQGM